jgi:hypothetical protein
MQSSTDCLINKKVAYNGSYESLRETGLTQMSKYTKDEALAFINAVCLTLGGKVGFKWLVEKLSRLAAYIESIAAENERLNAYVDWANGRDDYESYCTMQPEVSPQGDAREKG